MHESLAVFALFAFVYSTVARGMERTPINGALVFVLFGYLCGPAVWNILDPGVEREGLRNVAEMTLALMLFTDAAQADLRVLGRSYQFPWRLLLIGLPLTLLLGFVFSLWLLPGLDVFEAALVAAMLAPTDAALGKAVITNPRVPAVIRETLNVESGLNDGLCVPILFLFLAFAVDVEVGDQHLALAAELVAREIGIGVAVGVVITLIGSKLLHLSARRGWVRGNWQPVHTVALALSCFATAQTLGGSGFIAAFVGGLLFGALVTRHKEALLRAAESTGEVFALVTWVVFGALVVGRVQTEWTWSILLYAVLSLTLIRMLPVYIATARTDLDKPARLFLGWFGPRGLASIVFAVIVLGEDLDGSNTIALVVSCTVLLSVVAHGLSANPLARLFGEYAEDKSWVRKSEQRDHG